MKLVPTQGQPNGKIALQSKQQGSVSPTRDGYGDPFGSPDAKAGAMPGSPLRKQGKENTPPAHQRPQMQQTQSFINQAAASRQEPYRPRDEHSPTRTQKQQQQQGPISGGLTPDDIDTNSASSSNAL